jgi:hypothetical protein
MNAAMAPSRDNGAPDMPPDADRLRRRRSVAIALALGGLAAIFYAVSMVKTGR